LEQHIQRLLVAAVLEELLMVAHQLTAFKVPYLCFPQFKLPVVVMVVAGHIQDKMLDLVTQGVLGAAVVQGLRDLTEATETPQVHHQAKALLVVLEEILEGLEVEVVIHNKGKPELFRQVGSEGLEERELLCQ
jgi:hypothetical protein